MNFFYLKNLVIFVDVYIPADEGGRDDYKISRFSDRNCTVVEKDYNNNPNLLVN